jgi:hypothetical protein
MILPLAVRLGGKVCSGVARFAEVL